MTNRQENTKRSIYNFADKLHEFRKERGMSTNELARAIGLKSSRAIYDYENGLKMPASGTAIKIADALCVSLDSMFR